MGKGVSLSSTDVCKSHHSKRKKNIGKLYFFLYLEIFFLNIRNIFPIIRKEERKKKMGMDEGRKAGEERRKFTVNLILMFDALPKKNSIACV